MLDVQIQKDIDNVAQEFIQKPSPDILLNYVRYKSKQPVGEKLINLFVSLLNNEMRARYEPAADMVAENRDEIGDKDIATYWLYYQIYVSVIRQTCESHINNEFPDSLLLNKFPELTKHMDKDGLVNVEVFRRGRKLQDALVYKDYVFYLSEAIPEIMREQLIEIANSTKHHDLKVRMSHYRIIPLTEYFSPLKKAIDRGPIFSDKFVLQRLREKNITTVLTRRALSEHDTTWFSVYGFDNVIRMEVNRSQNQENNSTLVSLFAEVLNIESELARDAGYVENLIFHSDLYLSPGNNEVVFKHVDSSILTYKTAMYARRIEKKAPDTEKANGHFKLFWLSNCSLSLWKDLFYKTFSRTELVHEYFTGELESLKKSLDIPDEKNNPPTP